MKAVISWLVLGLGLWLAIGLLDLLGHEKAVIGELLDVGYVVVLGNVDSTCTAHHECKTAPDYSHLQPNTATPAEEDFLI